MTREYLESLGLEKEVIDKIMKENGLDIEKAKGDLTTKETELADTKKLLKTANEQIEDFKELDVEGIKAAAEDYKEKFEAAKIKAKEDLEKVQFEHELENAIRDSKAKNVKAVKALLDIDNLRDSKNRTEDIKAALEGTMEENDYLFDVDEGVEDDKPIFTRPGGDKTNRPAGNPWDKDSFNLTKQGQILREDPELAAKLQNSAK